MGRITGTAAAFVLAALTLAGCGGVTSPSTNVSTPLTFVVPKGTYGFSTFSVSRSGEYSIDFVSMTPKASVFLTLSLAQYLNNGCSSPLQVTNLAVAGHTSVLSGSIPAAGTYCVVLQDQGTLAVDTTVNVTVLHPQ